MRVTLAFIASSVATMMATAALAAQPLQDAPASAPAGAFTWTGPYAGLNGGALFSSSTSFGSTTGQLPNNTSALAMGLRPTRQRNGDSGLVGGAQIGYNYQFNLLSGRSLGPFRSSGVVVGAEADAVYTSVDRTRTLSDTTDLGPLETASPTSVTRINQYHDRLDYVGTARGRLGVALDQLLVYGTAGFAYGEVDRQITYYGPNALTTPFFQGERDGMKTGYTYGGGVEYALPTALAGRLKLSSASAITVKAEVLHYDLGVDTLTFPGVNGGATIGSYTSRVRTQGNIARAGISYKF